MSSPPSDLVPAVRVWSDTPTPRRRELLWIKEGKRCHWCGCPTRLCNDPDPDQATIEHILPRVRGGTNEDSNLTSACRQCNGRRSYEDERNMKNGALLGKWPLVKNQYRQSKHNYYRQIALTGDEKKAIVAKKNTEDILRAQRDQAVSAAMLLRKEIGHFEEAVKALEKELKEVSIWGLIRKRIAGRLPFLSGFLRV